ncbi:hypothetical protein BBJ28_00011631 [Nothophytophthora sp. Chile5]|nr:hypothetical protein BBJ28_00011631 [Nothophytophthora sp. Chile5]
MLLRLRAVALRPQPGAVRALSKSALVTLEKHQRVGILRLNDPKRLNPMTSAMGIALEVYYSRYMSLRSLKMPLVAALNGPAIGAGLCISLFADVRVAAKDAKLGFTSANDGSLATWGRNQGMASTHFLPLIVGVETANHLLLTGKDILAEAEGLAAALMREADAQAHSYTTKDFQEGLDALAAKRGPVFEPPERYSN